MMGALVRRLRTLLWVWRHIDNRIAVLRHVLRGTGLSRIELANGVVIQAAEDYDLWNHFNDIWLHDSYRLRGRELGQYAVIDVGANVGIFALRVGELASRVIALEPDPRNFAFLELNVGHIDDIEIDKRAVVGAMGKRALLEGPGPTGRFLADGPYDHDQASDAGVGHTIVDTITLGEVMSEYELSSSLVMLKLDCEGAEFEILRAADEASLGAIDVIVMEYHEQRGSSVDVIVEKLHRSGFKVSRYSPRIKSGMLLAEKR